MTLQTYQAYQAPQTYPSAQSLVVPGQNYPAVQQNGFIKFEEWVRLSLLVHGASKVGKSSLAATAPAPILALDAEGSWNFIPARKRYWNPLAEPPPVPDGTWDVCLVAVHNWATVQMVYQWIAYTQTWFTTLVVDSISEIQRKCRANLKGSEAMQQQDWGKLLIDMDTIIRGFRDLYLIPGGSIRCIVFIAETAQRKDGKWSANMQGAMRDLLPYLVDINGAMFAEYVVDANGQYTQDARRLWIGPGHPVLDAGERVQGRLPYLLEVPRPPYGQVGTTVTDWIRHVYGLAA